jgi:hypothetical protein
MNSSRSRISWRAAETFNQKIIHTIVENASGIVYRGTSDIRNGSHFFPDTRAQLDKLYAEEARKYGPMLDAMLLEAQTLRLIEGHKARERTLRSLGMDRASQYRSPREE